MAENEKELVDKSCNGDMESFERLVYLYEKKVFNIAYRMTGNMDDASELAQEVFIKVFKSIKQFKGQSSFSTWIYRITTNVCLDEFRKRKNRKSVYINEGTKTEDGEVEKQIAEAAPGPEELAEKNELKRVLEKAIRLLDDGQRLAIVLRDIQGLSYEEIAGILKCPVGTVKSKINRARSALRDILKGSKELFIQEYVKRVKN